MRTKTPAKGSRTPLEAKFTAEIVRLDSWPRHHVIPLPEMNAATWKAKKIRRLIATINGHPIKRALLSHADGGSFIMLGKPLLAELGLKHRSPVTVEVKPDPAPDALDLPDEFAVALAQDAAARTRWETFTAGKKRSLLVYVTTAEQEATRIKRSLELMTKIRTHTLYSDRPRSHPMG